MPPVNENEFSGADLDDEIEADIEEAIASLGYNTEGQEDGETENNTTEPNADSVSNDPKANKASELDTESAAKPVAKGKPVAGQKASQGDDAGAGQPADGGVSEHSGEPSDGADGDDESPAIQPPSKFTKEGKEWFLKQDPKLKQEISNIMTGVDKLAGNVASQLSTYKSKYEPFEREFEPIAKILESRGLQPMGWASGAVKQMAQLEMNPVAGLLYQAKKHGIDLGRLAEAAATVNTQNGQTPTTGQQPTGGMQLPPELNQRLGSIEQFIQQNTQQQQQQQQQQQEQFLQTLTSKVKSFAEELTPDRQAYVRPEMHDPTFREAFKPLFQMYMRQGQTPEKALETAYKQTVVSNPSWEQAYQQRFSLASQPQNRQTTPNNERASRSIAGSGMNTSPPEVSADEIPDSIEETIRLAAKQTGY